uniref:Uncharacterized protein n=1 Tax=Ixodes ricinus TaxID=34613 RepID=A0A6B0UU02_IXORI
MAMLCSMASMAISSSRSESTASSWQDVASCSSEIIISRGSGGSCFTCGIGPPLSSCSMASSEARPDVKLTWSTFACTQLLDTKVPHAGDTPAWLLPSPEVSAPPFHRLCSRIWSSLGKSVHVCPLRNRLRPLRRSTSSCLRTL